jgi:protein-tyrosine-phosphatase
MSKTVLFVCPHNAAKSVIAVAYFRRLAGEAGLDLVADSAGTEPENTVWPSVVELLRRDGLDVVAGRPRRLTDGDLADARLVVSMGCALPAELRPAPEVERWDDLPLASEDLVAARDAVRRRVEDLVGRLQSAGDRR